MSRERSTLLSPYWIVPPLPPTQPPRLPCNLDAPLAMSALRSHPDAGSISMAGKEAPATPARSSDVADNESNDLLDELIDPNTGQPVS